MHLKLIYNQKIISKLNKKRFKLSSLFKLVNYFNSYFINNLKNCKSIIKYYLFIEKIFIL